MPTRWTPDTCGCVLEYDDTVSLVRVHRIGPEHSGLSGVALFAQVVAECRRSNHCFAEIEAVRPGVFSRETKPFYFTGSDLVRVLHLVLPGLTVPQRLAIQTRLDLRFGIGLVIID